MKAHIDKELCIGCGLCPSICPAVFDMDDDGKAKVIGSEVSSDLEDEVKEAEAGCPVNAISI